MWKKTGRTYTGGSEKVFYLDNGGHFDHHYLERILFSSYLINGLFDIFILSYHNYLSQNEM